MDEKTTKLIKERFDALPEAIQEIILSSHYEETLLEIGTLYKLNVEQLGVLERETTLVMMGLTPTKDFQTELTRELNVDKEKGAQIVQEINEKIFLKIRDLLKLMNTPAGENPSPEEYDNPIARNTGVDWDVMKSAGIEIIKPELLSGIDKEKITESREEVLKKIEQPAASAPSYGTPKEEAHPILTQKLSGFTKSEVVETQHSLDNITKTNIPTPPTTPISKGAMDPYRETPE